MHFKKYFLLSIVLLISLSTSFALKAKENKSLLHFVQITDTHLNYPDSTDDERLRGSSGELLKTVINQINKIKGLDFILGTGDLVNVPTNELVDRFIKITSSFKYPFFIALGNHDVGVDTEVKKNEITKRFSKLLNNKSFTDGMSYYSFLPNDKFAVICLDGTTEEEITSQGQISTEELNWLKSELESNKKRFVIIAIHYPIIEPFESKSHEIIEPDRTKLLNLINSHKNIIGVFSGHYHTARLIKLNNKIHCSSPAVVQYPCAFREVTISQKDPEYLDVEFKWHIVDKKKLVEKSKNSTSSWRLSEGTPEDREQTIRLRVY